MTFRVAIALALALAVHSARGRILGASVLGWSRRPPSDAVFRVGRGVAKRSAALEREPRQYCRQFRQYCERSRGRARAPRRLARLAQDRSGAGVTSTRTNQLTARVLFERVT